MKYGQMLPFNIESIELTCVYNCPNIYHEVDSNGLLKAPLPSLNDVSKYLKIHKLIHSREQVKFQMRVRKDVH